MKITFGDASVRTWLKNKSETPLEQLILENEQLFQHAFKNILKHNPAIIRTPTELTYRHYLSNLKIDDRMEAIASAMVSSAQQAMESCQSGSALTATISQLPLELDKAKREIEYSELAVFQADKGIDAFYLSGFNDFDEIHLVCGILDRIHKADQILSLEKDVFISNFSRVLELCGEGNIRMIGTCLNQVDLKKLESFDFQGKPFCLELEKNENSNLLDEQIKEAISVSPPSLMIAGKGISLKEWEELVAKFS